MKGCLCLGGPPYHILAKPEDIAELVINFVPNQNVKTIRTEEAVIIALSIINYLLASNSDM